MVNKNYEMIIKIRAFEEMIIDLFGQNKLSGTTHTYIGQEATAVAIMNHIREQDTVFSNHRCHGHYLAYNGPEKLLLAEIMSKKSGLCQGKGGSQHIHYKNFYTNGIQGGIVPNAVGIAMADKLKGKDSNVIVFIGDGTLGQGVVYESLNVAAIYNIPVLFVIEDNQYAMSTRRTDVIAGDIKSRIEGFDIKTFEIKSTDVDELDEFFLDVFEYINSERKPVCAVIHNYRLGAHSKGDDTRDLEEITKYQKTDPIVIIKERVGEEKVSDIYNEYRLKFSKIVKELEKEDTIEIDIPSIPTVSFSHSFLPVEEKRYVEEICKSFEERLSNNRNTIIIGEDVRDPYGGAFKATKGLSSKYNERVLNMPISEACMVGLAVGLAMNGILPIVEIMFGDFVTLGFDQLLNHASKYAWVYGANVSVPMVIRVPSGAKRGYGPTHSQSLEKFLIGIPCIRVLAMSPAIDPKKLYRQLFDSINEPTVVIENKRLYGQKTWKIENSIYNDFEVCEVNHYGYTTIKFTIDSISIPDCYAITYGGMLEDVLRAAYELMMTDEIQVDVIALSQLSPMPIDDLNECINRKVQIIVIEEGTKSSGIGAEIIALCAENDLGTGYYRIATPDMPIPNGITLEHQIVPDINCIEREIRKVVIESETFDD